MASLLLSVVLLFSISLDANDTWSSFEYGDWTEETELSLPRNDYASAICHYNQSIFIIGGRDNPNQMIQYNVLAKNIIDYGPNVTATNVYGYGQFYTQHNNKFYMISNNNLFIADLKTNAMNQPWTNKLLSTNVHRGGCVAVNEEYLYVVGGGIPFAPLDKVQILIFGFNAWWTGPSLNTSRFGLACIIHEEAHKLYAIGGYDGDKNLQSIETLTTNKNSTAYQDDNWKYNNDLPYAISQSRAIIHGYHILVVGGIDESFSSVDIVQIIHILDGVITLGGNLNYQIANAAIVTLNNLLFVFGGRHQVDLGCHISNPLDERLKDYADTGDDTLPTCFDICKNYTFVTFQSGLPLIKRLPDAAFSASSQYTNPTCRAYRAKYPSIHYDHAWCAGNDDEDPWLQIDLGKVQQIESISTWGRDNTYDQRVTSYKFNYSIDNSSAFTQYNNGEILAGNPDRSNEVNHILNGPIYARYIRYIPVTSKSPGKRPSMRVEVYSSWCSCDNVWNNWNETKAPCSYSGTSFVNLYNVTDSKEWQYLFLPTSEPTPQPTIAPSIPSLCVDYSILPHKSFGLDITASTIMYEINDTLNAIYMLNNAIMYYNDPQTNDNPVPYLDSIIQCNKDNISEICIIECIGPASCYFMHLNPISHSVQQILVKCSKKNSCGQMNLNYIQLKSPKLTEIVMMCLTSVSCNALSINLLNNEYSKFVSSDSDFPLEITITIYCVETLACQSLKIINQQNFITSSVVQINVFCVEKNSCKYLSVLNDDNTNLHTHLWFYEHSEDVKIDTPEYKTVKIHCGNKNDSRYLQYNTFNLLNEEELLSRAQDEYASGHLPCEGVEITCKNIIDNKSYDQLCRMKYILSDRFDVTKIINSTTLQQCFWVDLELLFVPICDGTCGQNMSIYKHPISINFELKLEQGNSTFESLTCDEYFGDTNATSDTLSDIDVIIGAALSLFKEFETTKLIHRIQETPHTFLQNNKLSITCTEYKSKEDVIPMSSKFVIESLQKNEHKVYKLFAHDSIFYDEVQKLLDKYFGNNIMTLVGGDVITNLYHVESEIYEEIWFWCLLCVLLIIIFAFIISFILYRQKVKRKQEIQIIPVTNPMIITIGIGDYLNDDIWPGLNVDIDIANLAMLFQDELHYQVYPPFSNRRNVKLEWNQKDLILYLFQKAKHFNESNHDGLVVVITGHGIKDYVITSDGKATSKTAIHRIFSYYYPDKRDTPRLFIFDTCSGEHQKNTDIRRQSQEIISITDNDFEESKNDDVDEIDKLRRDHTINGKVINLEFIENLSKSDAWNQNEHNPDYKLCTVFASNQGYQAKMNTVMGSYLTAEFVKKMITNITVSKNKYFLFNILDEIQAELHSKGKQLGVNTYNNNTRYIKFIPYEENAIHEQNDTYDLKEDINDGSDLKEMISKYIVQKNVVTDREMIELTQITKQPSNMQYQQTNDESVSQ
eukprot:100035_1